LLRRRAGERALTIWCGACSSGQEPYSVAMLLQAYFPPLENWAIRVIASDLSGEMVERGRSGCYSRMEVNRGVTPALLSRFFQKEGDSWRVKESLRRMVEFHALNLIDSWPALPPLDLVLLRNVLIYFDAETKKQILGKVRRLLRPDGYLFLGGAETTFNLDGAFERVQFGRAGCYRQRADE
jgi:chemotaxis protein methyltransferase CheR